MSGYRRLVLDYISLLQLRRVVGVSQIGISQMGAKRGLVLSYCDRKKKTSPLGRQEKAFLLVWYRNQKKTVV